MMCVTQGREEPPFMKIILANRYFYPDQSATSRVISSLAFALARQGYPVTALASRHFHNRSDTVLPARQMIEGVDVRRVYMSGFGRANLAGRAVDYASFHLSASAWLLANARQGDICVLCTDPPFLSVTSMPALALKRARTVNWVMDLFPETGLELGALPGMGPLSAMMIATRNLVHRRSSLNICPTATMARYLERAGADAGNTAVVHHWTDGEEIHPVDHADNELRREWGLGEAFVVGYSGNFGRAHDFATLLDAADRLRGRSDIVFLLAGEGQQRAGVEAEARSRGLDNVRFKPFQPREMLARSLGASDVHVVSLSPALEHCIIPSKFYGVLAAGRPTLFVGAETGEIATVLREADCGLSVRPGDGDAMVGAILALREDAGMRARMAANARRLMERDHSLAVGVEAWRRAIVTAVPEAQRLEPSATGNLEAAT